VLREHDRQTTLWELLLPGEATAAAQLAGRHRGTGQPPQARLRAATHRLRRLPGARTWVGLGIFAYNLQRMTVVAG
jgi:hypothetical protein